MARKLRAGDRLVIASHNPGKVREIGDLIAPFGVTVVSAAELGLAAPEETGSTFAENAVLKARAAADESGLPALSDDSGLEVAALAGEPGIYSARWAGPSKDFGVAMKRVEDALTASTESDRSANFTCALTIAWPGGDIETFEGQVFGRLTFPPRGRKGFGYDPIFIPDGDTRTFGEFEPDEKHAVSHRARAFATFRRACLD